ncbi:MAG TPA: sensor domain-containing protein [Ktedonobacterales bacterium]|nr:sensor domain-containing protein [Ktedonobacterales bacterium]
MNYPINNQQLVKRDSFFSVARQGQTYLNLLYLLGAFPLGLTYFILLVVGLSVGVGTLVVWVGIPILLLTIIMWQGFASIERYLVRNWLHIPVPFIKDPRLVGAPLTRQFTARLRSPVTWTSLVYLFLEFPFGTISFALVIGLLSASIALIFGWLAYLIDTAIYNSVGGYNSYEFFIKINGQIEPGAMAFFAFLALVGIVALFASLHVLNAIAYAWGQLARLLLGMRNTALQLAEARAIAAQEHAKAERSEQSRRELIVNVSHELRTPIASIRGHVESLMMANEEQPANASAAQGQQGYLEIVHRETERLSALVDDLLALARAEAGELRLDLKPTAADEIVEEIYQTMAPLARRERQVTLTRSIPPGLPLVLADQQRLTQVLLNLVRNAITYTPAGGIVSISIEQPSPAQVALVVADTGIGIPPEDLERVFERFYRTDASRARSTGGFGLGLAIVRDLVTAMGGTISAESAVGEGSRFRLLLHVARTPAAPQSAR